MTPRAAQLALLLALASAAGASQDFQSGATPQDAVAADFNRDGRMDLAVACAFDDTVAIHLQNASGGFPLTRSYRVGINAPVPSNLPRSLAVTDFNHDGNTDLAVLCSGDVGFGYQPSLQSLVNLGNGEFARINAVPCGGPPGPVTGRFPIHMILADLDNNGTQDAVVANQSGSVMVFNGEGTGRFALQREIAFNRDGRGPQAVGAADIDGDGKRDMLALAPGGLTVFRQTTPFSFGAPAHVALPGTFTEFRSLSLGEFSGDRRTDAVLADANGSVLVLEGLSIGSGGNAFALSSRTYAHPSFAGCSDVQVAHWDADVLPDFVVANRLGNSFSVICSRGGIVSHAVAGLPRRFAVADFDGNGRADVATANEGDRPDLSNPGNPDISVELNPIGMAPQYAAERIQARNIAGTFPVQLFHPLALGIRESERPAVLEADRRRIRLTDFNATNRDDVSLPFIVGGIDMTSDDEGVAVERFAGRFHKFHFDSGASDAQAFTADAGELGFCGIAIDRDDDIVYVSAPSRERVYKIDEDNGQVLAQFNLPVPVWDLAWDPEERLLLGVNPGRSEIFTINPSTGQATGMDVGIFNGHLRDAGIAGIGVEDGGGRHTILLSGAGQLVQLENAPAMQRTATLSPLVETTAISFDATRNQLYFVGEDGFWGYFNLSGPPNQRAYSLAPAKSLDPAFVPVGICYDSQIDRVLISSRSRPTLARFTRLGAFEGFQSIGGAGVYSPGGFGGVEVDDATGRTFLLERSLVRQVNGPAEIPLPATSPTVDLAFHNDIFLTGTPNSGEVALTPMSAPATTTGVVLEPALRVDGFAFIDGSNFFRLAQTGNGPLLETYRFAAAPFTSAEATWGMYE